MPPSSLRCSLVLPLLLRGGHVRGERNVQRNEQDEELRAFADAAQELADRKMGYEQALAELEQNPDDLDAELFVEEFKSQMAGLRGGLDLSYDGFGDRVDSHLEKVLEPMLNKVESCYKELCRTKANILRQKAQGYKNLESQRAQAKRHVEKKICNIMNQVAYLNVCISHNGH